MNLERAIAIAVRAHTGQKDKAGSPYILHPLRLMLSLESEEERIAAVLHDVVEDTNVTFSELEAAGFAAPVMEAVRLLTKQKGVDYNDEKGTAYKGYFWAIKANPIARRVKLADLKDNLDLSRLTEITERDRTRLNRYIRARAFLVS